MKKIIIMTVTMVTAILFAAGASASTQDVKTSPRAPTNIEPAIATDAPTIDNTVTLDANRNAEYLSKKKKKSEAGQKENAAPAEKKDGEKTK